MTSVARPSDDDKNTQTARTAGTYHRAVDWHDRAFAELTVHELYAIVSLRERVFVVDQNCPFLECDGVDPASRHLWAARGVIRAYLRIVPAGARYDEVSIGRVVTAPEARGTGLGKELMRRGIAAVRAHHGDVPIRLGAQAYLERFYSELGFRRISANYLEDGIPHLYMLRDPGSRG
jgi:ElaA protein